MKTVIVPTDFSDTSINAMHYAAGLAKNTGSSILLFHAYQVPVTMTDTPIILVSVEDLQKTADDKLAEIKKELEKTIDSSVKIYMETKLGDTIDELENLCTRVKPLAVIMGSTGTTALERVFFGSTTLKAVRHLTCPVIVVPPGTKYSPIKKIGFACDFKEVVKTTPTHFIKEFVKEFKADLYVLNVDHNDKNFNPETPEQSALLHTLLGELNPKYEFIDYDDVDEGINLFADKNNLDLVITIPKKHKLLDGLFKKSHTKDLVFHSHVPIMCIHE